MARAPLQHDPRAFAVHASDCNHQRSHSVGISCKPSTLTASFGCFLAFFGWGLLFMLLVSIIIIIIPLHQQLHHAIIFHPRGPWLAIIIFAGFPVSQHCKVQRCPPPLIVMGVVRFSVYFSSIIVFSAVFTGSRRIGAMRQQQLHCGCISLVCRHH